MSEDKAALAELEEMDKELNPTPQTQAVQTGQPIYKPQLSPRRENKPSRLKDGWIIAAFEFGMIIGLILWFWR